MLKDESNIADSPFCKTISIKSNLVASGFFHSIDLKRVSDLKSGRENGRDVTDQ